MATTTKHPKDMTDADVTALVERLDDAVDRGEARVIAGDVLVELRAAAAARRAAEERLESAVLAGRSAGLSWGVIGAQLGVTRQGARQRFERLTET
jgi:hypothetical protein